NGFSSGLLFGLLVRRPLRRASPHGAGDRSRPSALAGTARNRANRSASRSAYRSTFNGRTLCLRSLIGSFLRGSLLLFGGWTGRRRSLGVDPCRLPRRAVAFTLVLQLLVSILAVFRKDKHPNISRG